jgi:hypothetical protein
MASKEDKLEIQPAALSIERALRIRGFLTATGFRRTISGSAWPRRSPNSLLADPMRRIAIRRCFLRLA